MGDNKKFLTLAYLRKACGSDQQDFGARIGLSRTHYGRKENGFEEFKLSEMITIQKHINNTLRQKYTLDEIFLRGDVLKSTIGAEAV